MRSFLARDPWGLLIRLHSHLSRRRRRQFVLIGALICVSALAEVVSLGAVLPFIGVLADPEWVFGRPLLNRLLRHFGIEAAGDLVLLLTVGFVVTALLAASVRTLLLWATTRLASECGAEVSIEVYRRTLYQPYSVHVRRNSSDVISGITNKIHGVVFGVLLPVVTMLSCIVVTVAITAALIVINPKVNVLVITCFAAIYGAITVFARHRLRANSDLISREQTQVVRALQEGLGGIREVLLDGVQPVYCEVYSRADAALRRAEGNNYFIGQRPRFAMEALGMVLIAGLAYALSGSEGGIAAALPLLGGLALGAQRLLPAFQQGHAAWASIMGHRSALADVLALLDQPLPTERLARVFEPLPLREAIAFDCVRFRYEHDGPDVLDGVNLTIKKGERIGLVGSTGSGKSTLMDVLMGLLTPTGGRLLVDGQSLSQESIRAWQLNIAHVPQNIFLADATIAENIAFGVAPDQIHLARVKEAAARAQIAEFIESREEGYSAHVGERGVRLSGGQRQRIGIARALYKKATVLVLDEATSALDNATEQSVMDAIGALGRELTIVIIAHRLTTVQRCDFIVELRRGLVVAHGTYQQLLECSATFRQMALGNRSADA